MSWKEFKEKELSGITKTMFASLVTSFAVFLAIYFIRLRDIDGLFSRYGFFLFFSFLSYAIIIPALKKARCYEALSCMPGMMIGMTMGMIAGFLPGFFIGATNGMFWGSIGGMAVGIIFGTWGGRCCGIMGVMEGMMAGFMGGLMGAMTSLMMLNDNLKAAGIVVFLISSVIITGLNLMIIVVFLISSVIITGLNLMMHRETKDFDKKFESEELFTIIISFILATITIWLMVFGPRSVLFQ